MSVFERKADLALSTSSNFPPSRITANFSGYPSPQKLYIKRPEKSEGGDLMGDISDFFACISCLLFGLLFMGWMASI